ncbi:PPOX class F420-dependent enzyme [Planotetraspora thailandica]|uniref:PPOX class F420-dependent enzyme n=1 Tax=Planotetraspora thailandica TaxID=487172 RepID=A0A8J3XYQ0_9ACTN|nr:PPOX class F420-dependent oxidoreductase [Planotetraspora thailandica]GII57561.1 PPOX class F420-dependent enzyme [Planotetraspora thailandica]
MLLDDVRDLFDGTNYATITSVNPDGGPQSSVVWVAAEGDEIIFSTVKGRRKHLNMVRDPRVAIVVIDPANPYRYAEIRGTVSLEDDPEGSLIQTLSLKYAGKPYEEQNPDNQRVIARIAPQKVYQH